MNARIEDRVWEGFRDCLVEWYLQQPNIMIIVCLIVSLVVLGAGFWYFIVVPANANALSNGSFEADLVFWGTGWLEDMPGIRDQARLYKFVTTAANGVKAEAHWRADPTEHTESGSFALKIEHSTEKRAHVYSTLAQRIRVKERTTYELILRAKVQKMGSDGDLWVSPNGSSVYWDQPKISIPRQGDGWKHHSLRFNSGDRVNLDIRFVAEAPLVVWVDDVTVRRVSEGKSLVEWIRGQIRRMTS